MTTSPKPKMVRVVKLCPRCDIGRLEPGEQECADCVAGDIEHYGLATMSRSDEVYE